MKKEIEIEDEQEKIYNESIKYNNTIVLGDKQFHDSIKKMNLPCENIYYVNNNDFPSFLQNPKKINNKYKICQYFIIMNEKNAKDYIDNIRYICDTFGLKLGLIIFIQDKNYRINKRLVQNPFIHIVIAYCEEDILNYYIDSLIRLKDVNLKNLELDENIVEQLSNINFEFPKISETQFIKEQDNGWEMIKNLNKNIFYLSKVEQIGGYINVGKLNKDMYEVYKENNCLDKFLKYYGVYFGGGYLLEQVTTLLTEVKLFIYAYTLEEKEDGKSFYSLMNNDLRSGDSKKISRYLPMINNIYRCLKQKHLKSYNGDIYRAAYFKKELIEEIKKGKKLLNASLWSSSKKLNVAKKFLFKYKKNVLLHTKIKEGSNIDIHLENISQYPKEEEILLLPFCFFEVESFIKAEENNLEYYKLELIYCEEENKSNEIENVQFKNVDFVHQ